MARCPACDAPRRADATFCAGCGAALTPIVAVSTERAPARRSGNPLAIGAVVVAVALVATGVVMLLTSSGDTPDAAERSSDRAAAQGTTERTRRDGSTTTTTVAAVRTATTVPATVAVAPTTTTSTTTTTTSTTTTTTTTNAPLPPILTPVSEVVPGDLGISGVVMTRPACDGAYVLMVSSAVSPDFYHRDVTSSLGKYPGSSYLRTDQTCASLRPDLDGNPIYSTYFGPYSTAAEACAERWRGPADAYVKVLSPTTPWNTPIVC